MVKLLLCFPEFVALSGDNYFNYSRHPAKSLLIRNAYYLQLSLFRLHGDVLIS